MRQTATNLLREAKNYILQPGNMIKKWAHTFETKEGQELTYHDISLMPAEELNECRACIMGAIALVGKVKFGGSGCIITSSSEEPKIIQRALKAMHKSHEILYGAGNIEVFAKRHNRAQITTLFDKAIELVPNIRV